MPREPGLRGRSRKGFESWVYVVPAISDERKRICNTSPRLPLLTSFVVWHGSTAFLALRLGVPLSFASMIRLKRIRQWYQLRGRPNMLRRGVPHKQHAL